MTIKIFLFWVCMAGVSVAEVMLIHSTFNDAGKHSDKCEIFINSLDCKKAVGF